jgi:hypothetical protein
MARATGRGSAAILSAAILAGCAGCGASERPPPPFEIPFDAATPVDGPSFDLGVEETAINCAAARQDEICACTEISQRPTSLYLVLDRSGSMLDRQDSADSKWEAIRIALFHAKTGVLRALGARVSVGLAVFPSGNDGACSAGREIVPPATGSPALYDRLSQILLLEQPAGATPTAATLVALAPKIAALPRPAFVLLATDGAPNCGAGPCALDRCVYNIEGAPLGDGRVCDGSINCCDPSRVEGGMGWGACIDGDATRAAVSQLAAAGVPTFVFGAPGVGPYATELDALAVAGGTAREAPAGAPRYYAVRSSDHEEFRDALAAIAAKVLDSCLVTLDDPPKDPGVTNVLLDGDLVAQDERDGWVWTPDGAIELRGASCTRIKTGVARVQVAVGCRTVTR